MTTTVLVAVLVFGVLVPILTIRRSLRQRPQARYYRDIFDMAAKELVSRPDLPAPHAEMLIAISSIPGGWIVRFMVFSVVRQMFTGVRPSTDAAFANKLPNELKDRYVEAMLSRVVSDSYHSAFFGTFWRATNSWVFDAIRAVRQDVNAHATTAVIRQVVQSPARRFAQAPRIAASVMLEAHC